MAKNLYRDGLREEKVSFPSEPPLTPIHEPMESTSAASESTLAPSSGYQKRVEALPGGQAVYEMQIEVGEGMLRQAGKATVTMTPEGIGIDKPKRGWGNRAISIQSRWEDVRELQNQIWETGDFRIKVGMGKKDLVVKLCSKKGREILYQIASVLDTLPPEAYMEKCHKCGAAVDGDICQACSANLATAYRSRALLKILIGVAVALLGITIAVASYRDTRPGDSHIVWDGAIVYGLGMVLLGLRQFFRGRHA